MGVTSVGNASECNSTLAATFLMQTEVKLSLVAKALIPILVTPLPIITEVKMLSRKACFACNIHTKSHYQGLSWWDK